MLEVYDRVLSSGNTSTLLMLTLILVFLLTIMGILDTIRMRIMLINANRIEKTIGHHVLHAALYNASSLNEKHADTKYFTDLSTISDFISSNKLLTLFDVPWTLMYVGIMYMIHPVLGNASVLFIMITMGLSFIQERSVSRNKQAIDINHIPYTQDMLRKSHPVLSMGMVTALKDPWKTQHDNNIDAIAKIKSQESLILSVSKSFRTLAQSLILGIGSLLAIQGDIGFGSVFAASLLLGRALSPVSAFSTFWRPFSKARSAYHRLNELLISYPIIDKKLVSSDSSGYIELKSINIFIQGSLRPLLHNISLRIDKGEVIGVYGANAVGKSTLVRTILGINKYTLINGTIRHAGIDPALWDDESRNKHIGYLPQSVDLYKDTIANNIARFNNHDLEDVINAAKAVGIHEKILDLNLDYGTELIGELLSPGWRQRIGLARAIFMNPKLIVLDEPDAHQDVDGINALINVIKYLRERGVTILIVSHNTDLLMNTDRVIYIDQRTIIHSDKPANVLKCIQHTNQLPVSDKKRKVSKDSSIAAVS